MGWLWETEPTWAMSMLADYMARIRKHDELVDRDAPRILLDDVLNGLRFALAFRLDSETAEDFIEEARREVPLYFGSDPNTS